MRTSTGFCSPGFQPKRGVGDKHANVASGVMTKPSVVCAGSGSKTVQIREGSFAVEIGAALPVSGLKRIRFG